MLIKWLKHGSGSAKRAVRYLLAMHDHAGRERLGVTVIRGNPELLRRVADSLKTKWKYSSAVIAWHAKDKPTNEHINDVLDDFEKMISDGLGADRICWCAVQHLEKDGVHIHVLCARVDLGTGKSWNPAPPGWATKWNAWQTIQNYRYHWIDPMAPERARDVRPSAEELRGKDKKRARIVAYVRSQNPQSRSDVLRAVKSMGTVTREGEDYISVQLPNSRPVRLKGMLFSRTYSGIDTSPESTQEREMRVNQAFETLQRLSSKQRAYLTKRYRQDSGNEPESNATSGSARSFEGANQADLVTSATSDDAGAANRDDKRGDGADRFAAKQNGRGFRGVLQRVCKALADVATLLVHIRMGARAQVGEGLQQSEARWGRTSASTLKVSENGEGLMAGRVARVRRVPAR